MTPRRSRKASQLATALIEHSSEAIALVDEAGTVLYANPATARMLGAAHHGRHQRERVPMGP